MPARDPDLCGRRSGVGAVAGSSRTPHLIGRRVALENEPLPAAEHVLPIFPVCAFRIVEQEYVVAPSVYIRAAVGGALLGRIAAVTELGILALAAIGTGDFQHALTACKSSCQTRTHRIRCRARIGQATDAGSGDVPRHARGCVRSTSRPPASP